MKCTKLSPFFPRLEEFEADNASGNFINIFCTSTNALFVCAKIVRFLLFRKYLIELHAPKAETTASITLIIVKTTSNMPIILPVLFSYSTEESEHSYRTQMQVPAHSRHSMQTVQLHLKILFPSFPNTPHLVKI